ncbi:MAG: undecaprenyl-diphosphate phosphatase [Oligoflexia bacterium]|nr:undecaprenyl-diphosphate phosphatase [Oligoflexia bacterium]
MTHYLIALLLGVIEGLTEFLPVSSTAHLRLVQSLLGIDLSDPYWKMFAVVIQLGAILCLPIYFRHRLWTFITADRKPIALTSLAFVVTAFPALLLSKVIGENLENTWVMGCSLVVGGVVMWVVDARARGTVSAVEEMSYWQAAWIGFWQIFSAVFPGTSRSMATIAGAQVAGMTRPAALEFSFLLSIPTMVAATGYDLLKSLRGGADGGALGAGPQDLQGWVALGIGFVVSFLVAYAVVAWFMRWVRTRGFVPFAIYRIILGTVVLVLLATGRG